MEHIKKVQSELASLGLYNGGIDGKLGPITIKAIMAFQRLHPPLAVDGLLGAATLAVLFPKPIEDRCDCSVDDRLEECFGRAGANLVDFILPYPMLLAWELNTVINKFSCNGKIKDNLENIFTEVKDYYKIDGIKELRLDLFGGCYNHRLMRGGTKLSLHAYGAAVDLDPAHNQLKWGKDKATLDAKEYDKFWSIVEAHGGYSLGRIKNYDWMHFQFIKP